MSSLNPRGLEFLSESNAIEDIDNIDYREPANCRPDAGHVGAFLQGQELARKKTALRVEDLCRWQGMICQEQLHFGHAIPPDAVGVLRSPRNPRNVSVGQHVAPSFDLVPGLMQQLDADLEAELQRSSPRMGRSIMIAGWLGEFFQRFEAIHPFVDGNGRTGRLLANYIATYCGIPILVFRASERPQFYRAHESKMAMRRFMADKLREAVFGSQNEIFSRVASYGAADRYRSANGKELLVEWHELIHAQEKWE